MKTQFKIQFFALITLLFQSCSQYEAVENKNLSKKIENNPELAYPNYNGDAIEINSSSNNAFIIEKLKMIIYYQEILYFRKNK